MQPRQLSFSSSVIKPEIIPLYTNNFPLNLLPYTEKISSFKFTEFIPNLRIWEKINKNYGLVWLGNVTEISPGKCKINALDIMESCSNFSDENLLRKSGILIRIFYKPVEENFKNSLFNINKILIG